MIHGAENGAFENSTFEIAIEWEKIPAAGQRRTAPADSELFTTRPTINSSTGRLNLHLKPDRHGEVRLAISLANGSIAADSLKILVLPVNDAPSFHTTIEWRGGINLTQSDQEQQIHLPDIIGAISPGGWDDEINQQLVFTWSFRGLTSDSADLVQDARVLCRGGASPCRRGDAGSLRLTIAPEAWGEGLLDIRISDSGGVRNGGMDSSTYPLQIRVQFYDGPPTVRLAVQLPCDLEESAKECPVALTLTKGSSCVGTYRWNDDRFLLPGLHPSLAQPFRVPVLESCSDTSYLDDSEILTDKRRDVFVLGKFAAASAGRPDEDLLQNISMRLVVEHGSDILDSANISDDGTLSLTLYSAPKPRVPPPVCWQRYAGRFLPGYLRNYGSVGFDLEKSKVLCSMLADCGGITRQYDVHGGRLWTLRAASEPSPEPDTHGCTPQTCESFVYKRGLNATHCTTQTPELDRVGTARILVRVSDGTQEIERRFDLKVIHPPFRLHERISVFAAAQPAVRMVENAAFGFQKVPCVAIPWIAGRWIRAADRVDETQLRCVSGASDSDYRRCRCEGYSDTASTFSIVLEQHNLSSSPSISKDGTLALPASEIPFLAGQTRATVTLSDGNDAPFQADALVDVRLVNHAPSFEFRNVTVRENQGCRAQSGWHIVGANTSYAAPVACRYSVSNVTWGLSAGRYPEVCLNCGHDVQPCTWPRTSCVEQRVSFRVEHVSDPSMFHVMPQFSLDGTLTFAIYPQASGRAMVSLRLVDDGGYNQEPISAQNASIDDFERPCSTNRTVACGSAAGPAQRRGDNGTDVSDVAFLAITILEANQQPTMVLDRKVSCLDARYKDACTCPSEASPFQENAVCTFESEGSATITVLENSGTHHVHSFVRQVSAGGGVPNQIALFEFEQEAFGNGTRTRADPPGEGNPTFQTMRADPLLAMGGLEAGVDFAVSPDGAHVLVAEYESSTLAVLERKKGDDNMRFLDRRGEGENRVRFVDSIPYETQSPCSAKALDHKNETFLAIVQGCEMLMNNLEHLPSYLEGDASSTASKSEEYGYLRNHTTAYFKFESQFMRGLYYRPRQGPDESYPCQKGRSSKYMTYINPGMVVDNAMRFPPARFETDICRSNSYQDVPAGQQPSLLTYTMNNGLAEALYFDGALLQALWVQRDVSQIEHLFPLDKMSIEMWFMIESPLHPIEQIYLQAAGLASAANGFTGWDVFYNVLADDKIAMNWAVAIEGQEGFGVNAINIERFQFRSWYHLVASFDGIFGTTFLNGVRVKQTKFCQCANRVFPPGAPFFGQPPQNCDENAPPPCTVRMPRPNDQIKGDFVIGAGATEAGGFNSHYGAIGSFRMFDVALTSLEVAIAYNITREKFAGRVPRNTYWSKAYGGGLVVSPSSFHADAMEMKPIDIIGRFKRSNSYTCRWRYKDAYMDMPANGTFAFAIDSTAQAPKKLCDQRANGVCLNPEDYELTKTQEKYYYNTLRCRTPRWGYGYKAAVLSVIEDDRDGEDELGEEVAGEGRRPLWQRTCTREDTCGYMNQITMPEYFSFADDVKLRQLWWLSGLSTWTSILAGEHSFGQNRGDITYFTFTTNSKLQHLDMGGKFTSRVVALPPHAVLGASKVEFFREAGSGAMLMAVANYWDGLTTKTNSFVSRVQVASDFRFAVPLRNDTDYWSKPESERHDSITLLQAIPTHGATGVAHFSMRPNNSNSARSYDYLAVSNYGSNSKIYRWLADGPITAVSIGRDSRRGRGYVRGVYRISSDNGNGFLAYSDTENISLVRGAYPNAGYNFTGGSLVCNPARQTECARIVSSGTGFVPDTSLPSSIADSQLIQDDYKCLQAGCDPLMKDFNCTLSREPVCNAVKVRGALDIFYDHGCARDDTACRETRMSESITTMTLMSGQESHLPGHTSNCRHPGVIFHNNTGGGGSGGWMDHKGLRLDSASLRVDYTVNSATGVMLELEFPDAAGHGKGYDWDPPVSLSDGACRCGTTVTEIDLIYGGQGYSSGTMTMSGSPIEQSAASGSGFSAEFLAMGNVTEISVESSGTGFTSPPRIVISMDENWRTRVNDILGEQNLEGIEAAHARAVAALKIDRILVLQKGSNYRYPPTVLVEEPQSVGGRRAQAEVLMEEDTDMIFSYATSHPPAGARLYRVSDIRVTDPGFGYTRIPAISFVDHPQEGPASSRSMPLAMAVLEIDKILVNHDYSKYSVRFREKPENVLHWRNDDRWFGEKRDGGALPAQNGEYVQTPSNGKLKGVLACVFLRRDEALSVDGKPPSISAAIPHRFCMLHAFVSMHHSHGRPGGASSSNP